MNLRKADPITFSVITNAFNEIIAGMSITLEKTAWSSALSLSRDFSTAIFDAQHRCVSIFDSIPSHAASMYLLIDAATDAFGEDIHDGDLFLINDPYCGNTHIGDVCVLCPVFYDGKIRFWTMVKSHGPDIGCHMPTSVNVAATDVFAEGLKIPPVRIFENGKEKKDIVNLYVSNLRFQNDTRGDLVAMCGSAMKGRQSIFALIEKYGWETVDFYSQENINYADRMMSEAVREIPDGSYSAEGWIDSDGYGNKNIRVFVTVTVKGDMIYVDYDGSAPQTKGPANATHGMLHAATIGAVAFFVDSRIPRNGGFARHIEIKAPVGTITNAVWPAATSNATVRPADAMVEVVLKALLKAMPEKGVAGASRWGLTPCIVGCDMRKGLGGMYQSLFFLSSGAPALNNTDSKWPLWGSSNCAAALKMPSAEVIEYLYPIRVDIRELMPDSAGAGEAEGGAAIELKVVITQDSSPVMVMTFGDGVANVPYGALGGKPGIGGGQCKMAFDGKRIFFANNSMFTLMPGESYYLVTQSGGGFGSPLDRPSEKVRQSVADELLSIRKAADVYGVVIDPGTLKADEAATSALRNEMKAKEKIELWNPTEPGIGVWVEQNRRDRDEVIVAEYEAMGM